MLRFVGNYGISVRARRNTTTNLSQESQFWSHNLNMVIQATNQKAKHPTAAFGFDRKEKKYSNRRFEYISHSYVDKTWSRFIWKWKLHGATCCNSCSSNKLPPFVSIYCPPLHCKRKQRSTGHTSFVTLSNFFSAFNLRAPFRVAAVSHWSWRIGSESYGRAVISSGYDYAMWSIGNRNEYMRTELA
jgi:hypothetical protein